MRTILYALFGYISGSVLYAKNFMKLFNKEEAEKYYLENKNFFIEKQFGVKTKQGRKKK